MELPPRFVSQEEIRKVYCLRKSLYGLKHSCLVNSAKSLRNLACGRVNLTTPSSSGTPIQVSFH